MGRNTVNFARLMIAGTGSGCGKTTVTCGILKALAARGMNTAAFKCGPDYIDPMFHTEIIGTPSRNLDAFLCGDKAVKYLFAKNGGTSEISVVEGVMGFYDGLGTDGSYSSHAISQLTQTPVVLVVGCSGMSLSLAAMVKGYQEFMPNHIQGVIINSVSPALYPMYRQMVEERTGLKVFGFLPKLPEAALESRHLGLITADEVAGLQQKLALLAENTEKFIDLDGLMALAKTALPLDYEPLQVERKYPCRIAVARDRAFCFYYRDSLELLEELGAELVYFSPLQDEALPEDIDGLILGGGYPELYAAQLSRNSTMLAAIKRAVNDGLPTYAECGGFMYLQQAIVEEGGGSHAMAGAIEGRSSLQKRLTRFGYAVLTAREDNLFCKKGEGIHAHEFHYSDSDNNGEGFTAVKPTTGKSWDCIFATDTLVAGYPHMHFYGNPKFAQSFVRKCSKQ